MEKTNLETAFERDFRSSGDNWKACCPFHDERTPSFLVHKEEYVAHCFGCGIGGTIDQLLAQYAGIPATEARARLDITASDTIAKNIRRRHANDGESQRRVFPKSWLAPFKKEIHKYVSTRGLTVATLRSVGARYDTALSRQVFPHYDQKNGDLLGCVGRACRGQEPKWFFYWDYSKGQALYRPLGIEPLRPIIVVEGIFDYLWLIQNGFTNVVATLGATATTEQVAELRSTGTDFIAGFDNDKAGEGASAHLYQSLKRDARVKFITWPPYVKDWMDLNAEQIAATLGTGENALQLSLRGENKRLTCSCSKHATKKARSVGNAKRIQYY